MCPSKVGDSGQGDAEGNLAAHAGAFDPLPEGLDRRAITNELLRKHGLPPGPDGSREPQLLRAWNRIVAQPTHLVRAELVDDPVMTARHAPDAAPVTVGWAGVARQATSGTDYAYPATMVFAEIEAPGALGVVPGWPPWDQWDWPEELVACWVGLTGVVGNQILRAGIAADVTFGFLDGSVNYWAWVESYTDESGIPVQKVSNFPVQPGDTVSILVWADGPGNGTAFLRNSRTGMGTSVWIKLPWDIKSPGVTTTWGVEAGPADLPLFGAVTFTNCWAGSLIEGSSEYFTLQPGAEILNIYTAAQNEPLTSTSILSPNSFKVTQLGWGFD